MATNLPGTDVVVVGLGAAGGIAVYPLTQAGLDPRELDQIIRDLQKLDNDQVFADPRNLAALQANALERIKNWEFDLRKKAEGAENQTLSLSGADEVPAGFRTQIEEYYRSLARKNK